MDLYFLIDVGLNLVTGITDPDEDGRIIYEPKIIIKSYLKSWFPIDFMAILPVDLAIRIVDHRMLCALKPPWGTCNEDDAEAKTSGQLVKLFKLLRLFRLLKLLRLMRMTRIFDRYQDDLFPLLP